MITTGATGQAWRASITSWGAIEPWNGDAPLNWFVAADDRWHVPADEPAVRQERIEGTAVTETRVRVPNGDVVQRIFTVADAGGLTVIEVENESTLPVAIAFDRPVLLTERPIGDVAIEGIDLPDGSFVMPLGHKAMLRVAIAHDRSGPGPLPRVPASMQVVRGWHTLTERASRLVLPDAAGGAAIARQITAERCELALGSIPQAADDPAGFALALGELVRLGEDPDHWLPELVDAVERLGPSSGWDVDAALAAAGRVLVAAGERRARADLRRIVRGRTPSVAPTDPPPEPPIGVRSIAWSERRCALDGALLPDGVAAGWLGQPVEVYGIPVADETTVSFALRWHGARPAVLWEQTGPPIELTSPTMAPGWSTTDPTGEALWPAPSPPPPPNANPNADPNA